MIVDELELVSRLKETEPLRPEALEQARTLLRAAIALDEVPEPTPVRSRNHLNRRSAALRGAFGIGVVAAAAVVTLIAMSTSQLPTHSIRPEVSLPAVSSAKHAPLVILADAIIANEAHQTGNATLVLRTTTLSNGENWTGADLYTDSGEYFYAPTESGLPAEIAANDDQGGAGSAREVAAAEYAVNGDLATARTEMEDAAMGHSPTDATSVQDLKAEARAMKLGLPMPALSGSPVQVNADNLIWENSLDALSAGAGNPQVRAGVLRLLSTVPEVVVTNTTTDGQPSLTLTAGAPALPTNYQEVLTISAQTGMPIAFAGGAPGQTPETSTTYEVSRVMVSDIAAGKFES
jgi:hypothetical protein